MDISAEFKNATILIVDDAPENIDILNDLLKAYRRKATTKANQALSIAKSAVPPDLILLDVMMPEIDGFEVCRLLKTDEQTKDIPVIFMTSLTDEENKVKGFKAGAVDYITKPIQAKEVLARVETHLRLYFLERRLKDTNQILELKVKERTSELEKARERAEEANRMKSHFMLLMNHEIRTPLAGIIGFTQILTEETDNDQHKNFLLRVQNSALRLKNTLDAILNLTRLESNFEAPEYSDVNIAEVLRKQAAFFRPLASEKNVDIVVPHPEKDMIYQTDLSAFEVIIRNLLDNAVKYTPSGSIALEIDEAGNGSSKNLLIRIKDTGIGFTDAKSQVIFEPFRQVHEGTGRNFEGVGLGLTIAKKYAELLGGKINAESTPGQGSVFTLQLPLLTKPHLPFVNNLSVEPAAAGISQSSSLPRILYVEDDANSRTLMSFLVRDLCQFEQAKDGETALKLISTIRYDAILMDINLGSGIDGIQAVQLIRLTPGYEKVPIAAITSYAAESDRRNFLKQGCTHFLTKPFSKNEIEYLIADMRKYFQK